MTIAERVLALPMITTLLAIMALSGCRVSIVQPSMTAAPTLAAQTVPAPATAIVAMPTATTQAMTPGAGGASVPKTASLELRGVT